MKLYLLLAIFIFTIMIQSCTHRAAFTGTEWEKYDSSEKTGFQADKLENLSNWIKENSETTGLVVIHNGKMVYDYGKIEQVSYIASCRKSVLSMLYGKHVENGTIDLNQKIGELGITEKDGLLPIEKEATIDHIITSRSGVFHVASNGGYDKKNFLERGSAKPGEYFVYNNWDFNVAGEILEQKTGNSVYQELEEQLAKPLGFQDWNIRNQKKSGRKKLSQYQAYHIYVSTRDMAKMGQLMLNEGEWNGQQLISKEWIKKTTTKVTPKDTVMKRVGGSHPSVPDYSYSYMWWLIESFKDNNVYEGAYTASGYGGQFITIIPKKNLVIAHKTKLSLPTLIGLNYKATRNGTYFEIVNQIVEAME